MRNRFFHCDKGRRGLGAVGSPTATAKVGLLCTTKKDDHFSIPWTIFPKIKFYGTVRDLLNRAVMMLSHGGRLIPVNLFTLFVRLIQG